MASKNFKKIMRKIDADITISSAVYPKNYDRVMKLLAGKARKVFESGKVTYVEAIPAPEVEGGRNE